MKKEVIDIGGIPTTLVIEKKRNKNMYLRLREDGSLYCTVPYGVDDFTIRKFIYSKEDWIIKIKKSIERKNTINSEIGSKEIYIFGHRKQVIYAYSKVSKVLENDTCIYICASRNDSEYLDKVFKKYASEKILELISIYRKEWDEKLCEANNISLPTIKVRYMTSRWGVCYPSKHLITMSTRLIHYPIESFQYVLLHEYVHFLVQNHSKKFYDIVEKYMPNYKVYNNYLR